jgi:hypothetical protein
VTARTLLFDRGDRVALVFEEGRWVAPALDPAPGAPVWSRGDLAVHSAVIAPGEEPAGARWWSLAELLAERPPFDPPELVDLIRRQLPSCFA